MRRLAGLGLAWAAAAVAVTACNVILSNDVHGLAASDDATAEAGDDAAMGPDVDTTNKDGGHHDDASMGADAATDAPTGDAPHATCATWAAAFCNQVNECTPGTMQTDFGTGTGGVANCNATRVASCEANLAADGSAVTQGWLDACQASLLSQATTCLSHGPTPMAVPSQSDPCAVVGAGASGTPCTLDVECASGACEHFGNTLCGACTSLKNAGESCSGLADTCTRGTTCRNDVCIPVVAVGQTCSAVIACVDGAECVQPQGVCVAAAVSLGAQCTVNNNGFPRCWTPAGFVCTTSNTCGPVQYVGGGQPCSTSVACVFGQCIAAPAEAGADASVCVTLIDAGGSCTPGMNECVGFDYCVGLSGAPPTCQAPACN